MGQAGPQQRRIWRRVWQWLRRLARRLALAFLVVAMASVVGWWLLVWLGDVPSHILERLRGRNAASSLIVYDAGGDELRHEATGASGRENWQPLGAISPHLIHATLASEDHGFYRHSGVDWTAMARALWLNVGRGEMAFGGSTITMQLVRLVGDIPRTLMGKIRQTITAARLEYHVGDELSKDDILEQYLNRVYYGNGAWGAEQAAAFYFGKRAAELSVGEAAMLAVIPRGPTRYNPLRHRSRAMARRSHILSLMEAHGYLTADKRRLAERVPLRLVGERPDFRAPHFVEVVKERLPAEMRQSARVTTTLDPSLQRMVAVAHAEHLAEVGWRQITQAAVVVMRNDDGAILAMVGSRDYHDADHNGAFNYATARLRPGSTLKPFVYATAMEHGDTPATIAFDVALPEDAHQFYTKDVRSHGFARYREALAGSYNLSAVHALQRVGIERVLGKLRAAGLSTLDRPDADYDWGLAIGHAEVTLLELTAAFSIFGRGGRPMMPRTIERAVAADGHTWREPVREGPQVFSREIAYLLFDILSDPDARKPMFGDRVPMNLPFAVALKTGTTKAYTDNWAIGTTREYSVGVWAGNFDGSPTERVMSIQGATPLLRAVYAAIAARYGDPQAPERPDAITEAAVCPVSGQHPGPHCPHHKRELFIAGHTPANGPEDTCDWHQLVCGEVVVVHPQVVRPWVRFYQRDYRPPNCEPAADAAGDGVRIVAPAAGATFVLEPHRPARYQRPPLAAIPDGGDVVWTINGEPADSWIPTPGTHTIVAQRGAARDRVDVVYE